MKGIYSTRDWTCEDPVDRAQLLLVMERVKPATTISFFNLPFLESILEKSGLAKESEFSGIYTIAPSDRLNDYNEKHAMNMQKYNTYLARHNLSEGMPCSRDIYLELKRLVKEIDQETYKINGRFYGYPECCIEAYTPANNSNPLIQSTNPRFRSRIRKSSHLGASKNPVLNFAPPSFTPCRNDCEHAIGLLTRYMDVLESLDPEAASALFEYNTVN
jgi:hypothetical protein